MRQDILEIILGVLEEWKDLQPNMKSRACQRLLATELTNALEKHMQSLIEDIVCGSK